MNRHAKRELTEWAKAVAGISAGMLFLAALEIAWVLDSGCIVSKEDAAERRHWEQVYSQIAVNPQDEGARP